MTISQTSSQVVLGGNGVQTVFQFSFVGDQSTDFQVIYTNASGSQTTLLPSQYLVALNPILSGSLWGVGGSVTYPLAGSPIASGTTLTISRIIPLQQLVTISDQGDFNPQVVEQALDILLMQLQQVSARTGQIRGTWVSNAMYNYGDMTVDGINGNNTGNIYLCVIANTSGVWATDLAAGDWSLALNVQAIVNFLPTIANNRVFGNISGVTATPIGITVSALIDSAISSVQGSILYRNASAWVALTPGINGQVLTTTGGSSNPQWSNVSGAGTVTSVATGTGLTGGPITTTGTVSLATVADNSLIANASGGTAAPGATTLSAFLDHVIGTTLGTTLTRGGSSWVSFSFLWQDNTNHNTSVGFNGASATISQSGGGSNGQNNTAFGYQAMNVTTTGYNNTGIGSNALSVNSTAQGQVAVGNNALSASTTGSSNTAVGDGALAGVTTGQQNTAVGSGAGNTGTPITTGTGNTLVGIQAKVNSATASNRTAIGNQANSLFDNDITLGNGSVSTIHAAVTTITAISDGRLKKDITDEDLGLEFILRLRPVKFRKINGDETLRDGFIAQEVEEALPLYKVKIAMLEKDEEGTYSLGMDQFIAPLVKAVQELTARVATLESRL